MQKRATGSWSRIEAHLIGLHLPTARCTSLRRMPSCLALQHKTFQEHSATFRCCSIWQKQVRASGQRSDTLLAVAGWHTGCEGSHEGEGGRPADARRGAARRGRQPRGARCTVPPGPACGLEDGAVTCRLEQDGLVMYSADVEECPDPIRLLKSTLFLPSTLPSCQSSGKAGEFWDEFG